MRRRAQRGWAMIEYCAVAAAVVAAIVAFRGQINAAMLRVAGRVQEQFLPSTSKATVDPILRY